MRILTAHNYYKLPGGEDTVFENETALLRRHGHEVFTYTRHNDELSPGFLLSGARFSEKTYIEVSELIKEQGIELLHVHNIQFLSLIHI